MKHTLPFACGALFVLPWTLSHVLADDAPAAATPPADAQPVAVGKGSYASSPPDAGKDKNV
jgi:hypothetical protein